MLTGGAAAVEKLLIKLRQCVENSFAYVKSTFLWVQWAMDKRILLSPTCSLLSVAFLLANCRTALRGGNTVSGRLGNGITPMGVEEYLHGEQ